MFDPKNFTNKKYDKLFKVSGWCIFCKGVGLSKKRVTRGNGLDAIITDETCKKCQGRRRLWYVQGSNEHKRSLQIVIGQWPKFTEKMHPRR